MFSHGIIDSRLRLYSPSFFDVEAIIPPLSEQTAIASYLDRKVADIDGMISKAERKIELLEELKKSVITEAVTKGLDKNAKMKDSGVKWIGKVPEEWNHCKTLYCLSMPITDGPHTTPELFDEGIPFVSAEAVSCGNGDIDFNHIRGYISEDFYKECCKKYTPQINDIYMIKSGATTGKVSIVTTDRKFTIWSPLAVFRVNKKIMTSRYLYYFLQSSPYQRQVEFSWSYGTQQNIGMRVLESLTVCYPVINEQYKIVKYLDKKVQAIDSQMSKARKRIELLKELKQTLITDVVTGKIKVTE